MDELIIDIKKMVQCLKICQNTNGPPELKMAAFEAELGLLKVEVALMKIKLGV